MTTLYPDVLQERFKLIRDEWQAIVSDDNFRQLPYSQELAENVDDSHGRHD